MKSKMKSTFAIIAVALMVLVAVVPMVGVFTETSDAIVVPDDVANVTISGKVYSSTGSNETGKYVKVSWGGSYVKTTTTDSNGYSFTIESIAKDGKITNVRIAVISDLTTQTEVNSYSVVTFSSLEPGAYNADLICGEKATNNVTVKFNGSTTSPKTLFTTVYGVGTTPAVSSIYVTYDLYKAYNTETKAYSEQIGSGLTAVLDSSDQFTVSVDKSVTSVYVKITKISVIPELGDDAISFEVTGNGVKNLVSETETVTFTQYTASITSSADLPVAKIKVTKVSKDTYTSPKIQMMKDLLKKSGNVYYIYDQIVNDTGAVQTADKISYTAEYGNVSTTLTDVSISANLATPYLLYGTYKMGEVSAADKMALSIGLATKNSENKYVDGSSLNVYVADGCYVAQFAEGDLGKKFLKITSTGFVFNSPSMNTTYPDYTNADYELVAAGYNLNVGVSTTGYTLLQGQLKNGAASPASLARSVDMKITSDASTAYAFGQPYSGNTITVTTSSTGAYKVYLATGSTVKFAPGDGEVYTLSNADGQYTIVGANYTYDPTVAKKTMKFSFVDGDGNALAAAPDFYAKFGNDAWSAKLPVTDGKYDVVDGTVDLDDTLVYFVASSTTYVNTFDAYDVWTAVDYEVNDKGVMKVIANEKTYAIVVKNANGEIVTSDVTLTINKYDAFVSETGNITYTVDGAAITSTLTDDGKRKFYVSDEYVGVVIGAKVQTVIAFTITGTDLIFDTIYQFEPASGTVVMTVESYSDSYSSSLLRLDATTGIPGIIVSLYNTSVAPANLLGKAITDEDGAFTILSKVAINKSNALVVFNAADGYTFEPSYKAFTTSKVAKSYFTSKTDAYTALIEDADEGTVSLTGTTIVGTTPATGAVTATADTADFSAAWKAGDIIQFTATKGAGENNTYRTFAPYTLTAEDAASGIIGLSTLESTYYVYVLDAEDNGLAIKPSVKMLYGSTQIALTEMNDINKVSATLFKGVYTVLFSEPQAGYEYIALPGNDDNYVFADGLYDVFEDYTATLASDYTKIYFGITDAAGVPIDVTNNFSTTGKKVKDKLTETEISIGGKADASDMLWFIGDPDVKYSPSAEWKTTDNKYTFKDSAKIAGGVLKAAEQKVYFTVVDANGEPLTGNVTIKAYDALGVEKAVIAEDALLVLGSVSAIYEVKDYVYGISGVFLDEFEYTFDYTTTTVFTANEGTYCASFATANGYDIDEYVEDYAIFAFNEAGAILYVGDDDGITADLDKVAYFTVTEEYDAWMFGPSETLSFTSTESYITGSVPYSGKGTQKATIELYLDDKLVKEYEADIVNKTEYVAFVDLSGYIGDTAGVVFDSILAVYYENNVEVGYAAVDPLTPVNNIVSPTVQVYVAVLDAPSALIARHVSIAQVGNTATVSADGQFIVADDDAIYTDGQYIYTFAGWYVDNEKVSSAPSFTFSLTENVVIVPEYTVKYEKISDANAQVDPEIIIEEITKENTGIDTNVLIIGICAVIVALIAVVYAVIKKE